jgi:hypothetical protein
MKFDIIDEKIEGVCDNHELYRSNGDAISEEFLIKVISAYNGLVSTWIPDDVLSSRDDFKIQFFIEEEYYQENKDEFIRYIEWISEVDHYEYISFGDEIMLKDMKLHNIEGLKDDVIPVYIKSKDTDDKKTLRFINLNFSCKVLDIIDVIFTKPDVYKSDKKYMDGIVYKTDPNDIFRKLFKYHIRYPGNDINWEPLKVFKDRKYNILSWIDIDDFSTYNNDALNVCELFVGFFDKFYENSGLICRIEGDDIDDEFTLDHKRYHKDYEDGVSSPRISMDRVIKKHNLKNYNVENLIRSL